MKVSTVLQKLLELENVPSTAIFGIEDSCITDIVADGNRVLFIGVSKPDNAISPQTSISKLQSMPIDSQVYWVDPTIDFQMKLHSKHLSLFSFYDISTRSAWNFA